MTNKGASTGEITLYGNIGTSFWDPEGVSAAMFKKDLRALGAVKNIDLRLNSDGGVITEAQAMYNLLVEHPASVHVHIDGIAASAASFLAMAGDKITISEGGFVMIHNARGGVMGQAEDFEAAAQILRTMNATIRKKYADRTGQPLDQIRKWMDAETWFDGASAVEHGFATDLTENMKMVACASNLMTGYCNAPQAVRRNRLKALERLKNA
jgi:ATP-dependent Clp endopeptidase proteolytic subunit ClpP